MWSSYRKLKRRIYRFENPGQFYALVDELWAKDDLAGAIAMGLHYIEGVAGRRFSRAIVPVVEGSAGNFSPNRYTWAIQMYGPVAKMMMMERGEVENDWDYGRTLALMVRSFCETKRLSPADRAWRSEVSRLVKSAESLARKFMVLIEADAIDLVHREILVSSGCLVPILKGEELDAEALIREATRRRDELAELWDRDPQINYDSTCQEVVGDPIDQEKKEDAELAASAAQLSDEEQPSSGQPVKVVLDWGHLGSSRASPDGTR